MRYFDVLYGQIDLDEVVAHILNRCWEVRRLQHVGMMNFRSISMQPLTHCSRLEHAIGTSYLAQRFAQANDFNPLKRRTFVAAALLHDINCSPFGHSVEWALLGSGKVQDHEAAAEWTLHPGISQATPGKPFFLDSQRFEPTEFELDPVYFQKLHDGVAGHTHIKSQHMDLDNIDNVFRMGHYLGIETANRSQVNQLVDGLRMPSDGTFFSVLESAVPFAVLWHKIRHDVYKAFIYHPEYLSFEAQIFEFVNELAYLIEDPGEITRLAHFPDDILLWQYFTAEGYLSLRPVLRRLIATEPYECLYVGRIENSVICNALPSARAREKLGEEFIRQVLVANEDGGDRVFGRGTLKAWVEALSPDEPKVPAPIHVHITTDKRKTGRETSLCVIRGGSEAEVLKIGEDHFYVVAALFSEARLSAREEDILKKCFKVALTNWGTGEVEDIEISSETRNQMHLRI